MVVNRRPTAQVLRAVLDHPTAERPPRRALVQAQTADAYRGRVFGVLRAVQGVALLVGLGAGGVLGDAVAIVPVLSASAAVRVLGGLVALTLLPRGEPGSGNEEGSGPRERTATAISPTDAAEGTG